MAETTEARSGFSLLDRPDLLRNAITRKSAAASGWIAVDAERASGFRYSQRAYLIQIKFLDGAIWLVDPLVFNTADEQSDLLSDFEKFLPKNWILHSATQDFPCLFELGLRPSEVFDTEVAAKILGMPRVGLATLVEELVGVSLDKEHSASDWSRRPLTQSMLHYAALDVEHLHEIRDELIQKLIETDRLEWAMQEFEHLLNFKPKPMTEDRWRRLPGIVRIRDERVLKAAKALWFTRENLARELDISPGRVLPDSSIMAAANSLPSSRGELAKLREFSGRYSRSKLDLWWESLQASHVQTLDSLAEKSAIPNHRSWERRHPEAHSRYQTARTAIQLVSEQLGIAPEVLISPEVVRTACFLKPESEPELIDLMGSLKVRKWQLSLMAPTLAQALSL